MGIGLFDSVKGNMIHYFVRPDDCFILNTLEKLDASTYLYRLLRDEGYRQIFFINIQETNFSVTTYDQFSYWATVKPKEFGSVDVQDPEAISAFLGGTSNAPAAPAGNTLNTRFIRTVPQPTPDQRPQVQPLGRCQLQTFATQEEFVAFILNRISPAINSDKVKTAVVMPMEIFEKAGHISESSIDSVIIDTIRNAKRENVSKTNIVVLTTPYQDNLANCMDITNLRDLHYWVPGVLRNLSYQDDRVARAVEALQKEGILVLADSICEDEIANLLLRKKLVECDRRFEQLQVSRIYQLSELLAEQCRMEHRHFQSFAPFKMHDYIRQLESLLSNDRVVEELVEKSMSLKARNMQEVTDVSAVALERVTHRYITRCQRSREEIEADYREAMAPLDNMIGMGNLRTSIEKHLNTVLVYGGAAGPGHYIFAGNPGTGKTVVARMMGDVFKALGLLRKGHLVECKKADLVAEHIGGSAIKTKKKCMEALDGVLFVDEAYELVNLEPTGQKFKSSFDEEAYTEIMTFMENYKTRVCVIFAGYSEPMKVFRTANPGMPRRLPEGNIIEFTDYNIQELCDIFTLFAKNDPDGAFTLSDEFTRLLKKSLKRQVKSKNFGNAGQMRELFQECKQKAASRVYNTDAEQTKYLLLPEDLPEMYNPQASEEQAAEAMAELNELIGLENVKAVLAELLDTQLAYDNEEGPGHYVFSGNPGTGKTQVARLMGKILKAQGLLTKGHLVECKSTDLVAGYLGQTAIRTRAVCESALDGVLFIDEAYNLVNTDPVNAGYTDSYAEQAYNELMTFMDNNRQRICVIFAGYTNEMQSFVSANPGMERRITQVIQFPDYNQEELFKIFKLFARKDSNGFTLSEEFEQEIRKVIRKIAKQSGGNFGNAGAMRKLFESIKKQAAGRYRRTRDESTKYVLLPEDIPEQYHPQASEEQAAEAMAELNELIGLENVKAVLAELLDTQLAYDNEEGPGHYVFSGNPGTGKTQVARLMGKILKAQGLLTKGHLVECKSTDLVAGYLGQTAIRTRAVCESALDGVLFIDEAYNLVNTDPVNAGYTDSYAEQAYNELMTFMDNNRQRICVIFAGYTNEMQSFVSANPGMERRITQVIQFPDYNQEELFKIFKLFARKDSNGFTLSEEFEQEIRKVIRKIAKQSGGNFGNAGAMRKLFESIKKQAAGRYRRTRDESTKYVLLPEDIPEQYHPQASEEQAAEAMAELNELIGLENVKAVLAELLDTQLAYDNEEGPGHYVFSGNPGTGKTQVARLMGKILKAQGLLTKGHLVECKSTDLVAGYLGQTAIRTRAVCESALDGVLFIDEAYNLVNTDPVNAGYTDSYAEQAYNELMTFMDNNRQRICVIFAGYTKEMESFVSANPGMERRITQVIHFPDYNKDELFEIFKLFARKDSNGFTLSEEFEQEIRKVIRKIAKQSGGNFGNAGAMRKLFESIKKQAAGRYRRTRDESTKYVLLPEDIPEQYSPQLSEEALQEAMAELNAMIGLGNVKNVISEMVTEKKIYGDSNGTGHFAFVGNPGTGKTEVARMMGRIFKAMGLLTKDNVVVCDGAKLVGQHVGETPAKVRAICERALGGVLFVDEAYRLINTESVGPAYASSFAEEAYTEIMTFMEDNRHQVCVIFAGYRNLIDKFLDANEGMRSRVGTIIDFPDYADEELLQILKLMATQEGYSFASDFDQAAVKAIALSKLECTGHYANAREMRKLLSQFRKNISQRMKLLQQNGHSEEVETEKYLLTAEDTLAGSQRGGREDISTAMAELNAMIGLKSVKDSIRRLKNRVLYSADPDASIDPGHYLFVGNPGTGKTEVARLMGRIFKAIGLLPKGHVVEVDRSRLVGQFIGQTAPATEQCCREALGGILFVDEAYTLFNEAKNDFGREALNTIMKFMEDHRSQLCVIFVGYEEQMAELTHINPGFTSRIRETIHFPDYSLEELVQILRLMADKRKLAYTDEFLEGARKQLKQMKEAQKQGFGNARAARALLDGADARRADRIALQIENGGDRDSIQANLLTAEDLGPFCESVRPEETEEAPEQVKAEYRRIPAETVRDLPPCYGQEAIANRISLGRATDPAVLFVQTDGGCGTAFLISPDGYAITCNHVISNAKQIRARFRMPGRAGQDDSWHDCHVVNTMSDLDIALLKLEGRNFPYLKLASRDREISKGEEFLLSGYPFGQRTAKDLTTFYGYVASSERQTDEHGFVRYYINSEAKSGNSGAPVIALSDGSVIGMLLGSMTVGRQKLVEEINYMRPMYYFWEEFVDET